MTYSKTPDSLALRFCYFEALLVHGQINQDRTIRPTLCHLVHGHATAKQLDNSATYVRWQLGTARIHSAAVRRYDTIRGAILTCAEWVMEYMMMMVKSDTLLFVKRIKLLFFSDKNVIFCCLVQFLHGYRQYTVM